MPRPDQAADRLIARLGGDRQGLAGVSSWLAQALGDLSLSRRRTSATSRASQLRSWRSVVVLVALTAFALQSYVTQTHIHMTAAAQSSQSAPKMAAKDAKSDPGTTPRDRYPSNQDPANCPLCQEILHAGHYVAPSAVAFFLPSQSLSIIPLLAAAPVSLAPAGYSWQSRAPPRA
jgi:hypothetical protein